MNILIHSNLVGSIKIEHVKARNEFMKAAPEVIRADVFKGKND